MKKKDVQKTTQAGHPGCDQVCEVWPTRSRREFEVVCPQHGNVGLISWSSKAKPPRFGKT